MTIDDYMYLKSLNDFINDAQPLYLKVHVRGQSALGQFWFLFFILI